MKEERRRVLFVDIAKAIGLLLVIHNHFKMDYSNNAIKIVIASFHMPLFFILSGYTTKVSQNMKELIGSIIKKIGTIMIPYFIWTLMYSGISKESITYLLYGSNRSIYAIKSVDGSWFLPCFFAASIIADIILFLINKYKKEKNIIVILITAVACCGISYILKVNNNLKYDYPFSLDVAFTGASFILFGAVTAKINIYDKILKFRWKNVLLSIGFAVVTVIVAYINIPSYSNWCKRPIMALGEYGYYPLFIITGIIGTVSILFFSVWVENFKIGKHVAYIGRYTLVMLLLQQRIIDIIENIVSKKNMPINCIVVIGYSVAVWLMCFGISWFVSIVVPNFAGRKNMEFTIKCKNKES